MTVRLYRCYGVTVVVRVGTQLAAVAFESQLGAE